MSQDLAAILDSLGPARRFADPSAPIDAKLMAAGGSLPLPPPQLVCVLYLLAQDDDAGVKEKAISSIAGLPDRVLNPALTADIHPAPLAYLAEYFREDEAKLEKIALNAAASDDTFCFIAARPFPRLIDIVSHNQVRLMRCPALVDALGENSLTSQSTIDRILQFLGIERREMEVVPPPPEDVPEPPPPADNETRAVDLEDPSDLPPELTVETETDEDKPDEEQEEENRSLLARVQEMNVMEKVKLARFGNGEARAILVRDRNKIVASAAIRSPKIQESEVATYAKSRNLSDDVLRIISNNREWTKGYEIKLALATNPRAPHGAAIKFLNYLTDRDLKTVMRSKELPGPISLQARRILARKGKI